VNASKVQAAERLELLAQNRKEAQVVCLGYSACRMIITLNTDLMQLVLLPPQLFALTLHVPAGRIGVCIEAQRRPARRDPCQDSRIRGVQQEGAACCLERPEASQHGGGDDTRRQEACERPDDRVSSCVHPYTRGIPMLVFYMKLWGRCRGGFSSHFRKNN
jgi:hypothetical protein